MQILNGRVMLELLILRLILLLSVSPIHLRLFLVSFVSSRLSPLVLIKSDKHFFLTRSGATEAGVHSFETYGLLAGNVSRHFLSALLHAIVAVDRLFVSGSRHLLLRLFRFPHREQRTLVLFT